MRFFVVLILSFFVFAEPARSEMFDVRAFSRQRGFKAYRFREETPSFRQNVVRSDERKNTTRYENNQTSSDSQKTQEKKLHQTGIKIFQKKDENKVLNFDVENPEFKKLNKNQQRDLVNRITIE